ncbi:hypothetical protein HDU77_009168 [Chytriomyces hyalinus]|nr:hypothetical protein HDU77_009168 [Chytriomyces hyalinus]
MRFNLAITIIFATAATIEAASIPRFARDLSFRDTTSNRDTMVAVPGEPAAVDDAAEEENEVDAVDDVNIQTGQIEASDDHEGDDGTTDEGSSENENKDDQNEENENTEDDGPADTIEAAENDEGQSEEEAAWR